MTAALDYPLQRDAGEHARLHTQAAFWSPDAAAAAPRAICKPASRSKR